MMENIDLVPAGEIKTRAVGEKIEAGPGHLGAPLARQPLIENVLDFMQVEDV